MATTLDATVGGASANSYATLAQASAYVDTLVPSTTQDTWLDAGDEDQARALIMATRLLDSWYDWNGSVTSLSQALLWPRRGVLRPGVSEGQVTSGASNPWHTPFGTLLPEDEIPELLLDAVSELARQLLAGDRTADSDTETQGIESLKAGSIELAFRAGVTAKVIPDAVASFLNALGRIKGRYGSGGAVDMRRA